MIFYNLLNIRYGNSVLIISLPYIYLNSPAYFTDGTRLSSYKTIWNGNIEYIVL